MVEKTSYSCTDTDERDKYGNYGKPLSKPGKCKRCGATVLRLYDEGLCLMCKINRTADTASKVIPSPKSTLFKRKKIGGDKTKNGKHKPDEFL